MPKGANRGKRGLPPFPRESITQKDTSFFGFIFPFFYPLYDFSLNFYLQYFPPSSSLHLIFFCVFLFSPFVVFLKKKMGHSDALDLDVFIS